MFLFFYIFKLIFCRQVTKSYNNLNHNKIKYQPKSIKFLELIYTFKIHILSMSFSVFFFLLKMD